MAPYFLGVRSLVQKVRDFIVDFVDRLKKYAVDYAVDQDRTEILAMQSREQDAAGTLEQIARTFDLALESAREKAQSGDGAAQTERADGRRVNLPDGVKYSIKSFREQIQDVLDGKFPRNDHVYVMDTPEVLQKLGLKALPMLMTQRHARTTTLTGIGHRGENYHGLGLDLMEQLPNAIANPVMVIKSYNYVKRITVITQLADGNGDSVIAAVEVNGYGTWENVRIDSNTVASVYGKEHIRGTIKRAIKNDEVMYIDKNKSASFAQSVGVQFPESLSNGNSYVHSVFDLMPAVKSKNAENHAEDAQDTANSEQTQAETPESEPNQENGEQKFSLKNESADKVNVDQMLRAGDSSMAGQTGTEEQTRHTPVDVTETMRQWADKRAGQIIREYRSTIDGESVREDMARLVNELAENGASSDALNATVNMAKGIIEKRYCRKYDDVCAHAHIPIHVSQGTTVRVRQRHDGRMISIHAPLTGSDWQGSHRRAFDINFNPRSPHGERPSARISIFLNKPLLQSTLPSRGATLCIPRSIPSP